MVHTTTPKRSSRGNVNGARVAMTDEVMTHVSLGMGPAHNFTSVSTCVLNVDHENLNRAANYAVDQVTGQETVLIRTMNLTTRLTR